MWAAASQSGGASISDLQLFVNAQLSRHFQTFEPLISALWALLVAAEKAELTHYEGELLGSVTAAKNAEFLKAKQHECKVYR